MQSIVTLVTSPSYLDLDLDQLILAGKEKRTKGREEDDDKKKKNEFLERGIFVIFSKNQISRLAG